VTFEAADNKAYNGTYTFTFKNGQIRKELKLTNGFQDIVLINTNNNTIYSLRNKNGKMFAIQLSMEEMTERQKQYKGYSITEESGKEKMFAGKKGIKSLVRYKNGMSSELYLNKDWYAEKSIAFERFPDARFIPLMYSYKDDARGFSMQMEVESISEEPVENSMFRIPEDYRIISNEEYKQLSRQ
jgi:hypothetical protein